MTPSSVQNRQIAEEAAEWAVAIDAGPLSTQERQALAQWVKESPRHVEELLLAAMLFNDAGDADADRTIDVEALLKDISAEIVPLGATAMDATGNHHDTAHPPRPRRRLVWAGLAASLLLVVTASLAMLAFGTSGLGAPQVKPLVVATALGEQRAVTLDDGSVVYVNTLSEVRVDYSETVRSVELVRGEALFDVEKDHTRPFRVIAGDTVAEALGTTFNVRFIDDKAEVSVVEGTVAFMKKGAVFDALTREGENGAGKEAPVGAIDQGQVILEAGEQAALLPAERAPRLAAVDVEAVSSWRVRRLSFENDPLADITSEFNRYNRTRLVLQGNEIGQQRFTGVFAADDPESFVAFLELTGAVESREVGSDIYLRAKH